MIWAEIGFGIWLGLVGFVIFGLLLHLVGWLCGIKGSFKW